MAAQLGKLARRVAATAALSLAMGGMMAMAQDSSAPPATQADPQAQGPMGGPHGHGGPERQVEMLTKRLNLTPDQVTQVKAIDMDAMTQMHGLRSDTTMSEQDKHAKMKGIHEDATTKIRAVLNDEQKTKYDAMEARHKEHMQHGNGDTPPAPPTN